MSLRELREWRQVKAETVASALSVSLTFVRSVEAGRSALPARHVAAWARAIGVGEDLVARYVPGEVDVTGLRPDERSQVAAFVERLRAASGVDHDA
jgi:transcriptional regulator with XRE-family HTH domain